MAPFVAHIPSPSHQWREAGPGVSQTQIGAVHRQQIEHRPRSRRHQFFSSLVAAAPSTPPLLGTEKKNPSQNSPSLFLHFISRGIFSSRSRGPIESVRCLGCAFCAARRSGGGGGARWRRQRRRQGWGRSIRERAHARGLPPRNKLSASALGGSPDALGGWGQPKVKGCSSRRRSN